MLKEIRQNPRALMYAVLMHLLLFLALIISLDWKTKHADSGQGDIIKAQVVDSGKVQAEVAKLKQAEQQKQHQEEARQAALERAARQEQQQIAELKQKQVQEQQHLRQLQQQRVAQQQAEQVHQAKLKQQQAALDRQAKLKSVQDAKAQKQHQADEKKQRAAAAAQRQTEAEHALQQQLAAEEHAQQQSGHNQDIVNQYIAGIKQAVENNWLRPAGSRQGLSCTVLVNLIPGGDVAGVRIVESSGDAAFDRSVENAVRKAAPLPLPPDPALFDNFRELRFIFKPES